MIKVSEEDIFIFKHELGHAIGLNHNHDQSIMNINRDPDGNSYEYGLNGIQPTDITNFKAKIRRDYIRFNFYFLFTSVSLLSRIVVIVDT